MGSSPGGQYTDTCVFNSGGFEGSTKVYHVSQVEPGNVVSTLQLWVVCSQGCLSNRGQMLIQYWHICVSRLGFLMFLERLIGNLMEAMHLPSESCKYIYIQLRIWIPGVHGHHSAFPWIPRGTDGLTFFKLIDARDWKIQQYKWLHSGKEAYYHLELSLSFLLPKGNCCYKFGVFFQRW